MENTHRSRKRRRRSPQKPVQGIFTRSRYEIFIKRTRSGRGRADSNRGSKLSPETERPVSSGTGRILIEEQRPGNASFNDSSLIYVKDLRTRRVFSPPSVDEECSPEKKPKIQTDTDESGFDGKIFEEQNIDISGNLMQVTSSNSGGRSPESGDAKREMGFDGEICFKNQVVCNGIETISGAVDGLDEMTQTPPPESNHGRSELSTVQREEGFDGESCYCEKKIDGGVEAIPGAADCAAEEWIHRTPPDGDVFRKADVQESGGSERGAGKIDADCIEKNPSNARISGDNPFVDEGFVQTRKDETDTMIKNRPALVPCSRIKLFQAPNSLSYRRLLPFLMDLAKDNAGSVEIRSCKSLYATKFKKLSEERPQLPLLDTQSHVTDLCGGSTDMLSGQNCVDDLGTQIIERSAENRLDGCLATAPTGVSKEKILDGLSITLTENQRGKSPVVLETPMKEQSGEKSRDGLGITLTENQRGKSPDVLETPMKEQSSEKSGNGLEISLTEKSLEMSSVAHCLNDFETPPAYKSVEMCHTVSSSDPSAESQIIKSLEDRNTETCIQDAAGSSTSLRDPAVLMLPDFCTETVQQIYQDMNETSCKVDHCVDSVGSTMKIGLPYESLSISPNCSKTLMMEWAKKIQDPDVPRKNEGERKELLSASSTDAKLLKSLILQHSSQSEASYDLETPVLPPKGILKTHPRECRGLCMCPDCSSFRLYAEKSNEFSRKQMQDAEKMAVGLMKELSYLRNMMAGMIASGVDDVRDQEEAMVQVNQIKGFCRRASRAEELARDRLRQMTRNLNTQCRITTLQRPKVRFADNLEERLILELEKENDG